MWHPPSFYKELREDSRDFKEYVHKLFWLNVKKLGPDDCWEWGGCCHESGYGVLSIIHPHSRKKNTIRAHKLSWWVYTKKYIKLPLCVCHHCDNPRCVNPHHLFVGTYQDNVTDKVKKGRQIKGSNQRNSKMTEKSVKLVRRLNQTGWNQEQLAERFGVSFQTISGILRGDTWKHVPMIGAHVNYGRGEKHRSAILTTQQVTKIREEYALGLITHQKLGEKYGVNYRTISNITRRKTWKNI